MGKQYIIAELLKTDLDILGHSTEGNLSCILMNTVA